MDKLLFLDVDGVLNSARYIHAIGEKWDDPVHQMDPTAVQRLNQITDATQAQIVVSSTWRLAFDRVADGLVKLQHCFADYGITGSIIGMTPYLVRQGSSIIHLAYGTRSDEIRQWLTDHDALNTNFVILDDETIVGFDGHHIKTEFETGLLDVHVQRAIQLLGA